MENCELAGNVIKSGVEPLIVAAEQKIGELLHENGRLQHQAEQFKTVYREFNNLLCHIGYEGSVGADSRFVWDAMQALKKIDGGVYGEQFAEERCISDQLESEEDAQSLVSEVMRLRKNPPNGSSWY